VLKIERAPASFAAGTAVRTALLPSGRLQITAVVR
jgi:hypothetical protein